MFNQNASLRLPASQNLNYQEKTTSQIHGRPFQNCPLEARWRDTQSKPIKNLVQRRQGKSIMTCSPSHCPAPCCTSWRQKLACLTISLPNSQAGWGSVGLLGSLVFSTSFWPNTSQGEAESINLSQKTPSWETKATKAPLESLMLTIKSQIIQ